MSAADALFRDQPRLAKDAEVSGDSRPADPETLRQITGTHVAPSQQGQDLAAGGIRNG
jgi:hypothetical protein